MFYLNKSVIINWKGYAMYNISGIICVNKYKK
jgi:hypothetical protein